METAVADVQEFGGDVAFPEGCEAFVGEDVAEGLVGSCEGAGRCRGGLELESDLEYVEGSNAEAGDGLVSYGNVYLERVLRLDYSCRQGGAR